MRNIGIGLLIGMVASGCSLLSSQTSPLQDHTLLDIAVYKYGVYVPADPQHSDTYTPEKRAEDNWACQQQSSQWTVDGYVVDAQRHHQCMVNKGWKKVFVVQ